MKVTSIVIAASFVWLVVSFWNRNDLPRNVVLLPALADEPIQSPTRKKTFEANYNDVKYLVEPEFDYELHGMIVSYRHHDGKSRMHFRSNDHLNMLDVCVVWGDNATNPLIHKLNFWNGIFTCNVKTKDQEAWDAFDIYKLSNNHLISDDEFIRDQVKDINIGDQIRVRGYLASYGSDGGGKRGTSTTRLDTGDGACETLYVEDFDIIRAASSNWRLSMYASLAVFLAALIMHFRRPYRPYRGTTAICLTAALMFVKPANANDADADPVVPSSVAKTEVPDLRNEENPLIVQKGDFVAVPIPMSSPTFGTGLVAGAAYFYGQTEEQKETQPASLTGGGAAYTTNDSYAVGIGQQNYWDADKWRFNGIAGYVDFKFELRDPDMGGSGELDWDITGGIFQTTLLRRIGGRWYAGLLARYLDITQDLVVPTSQTNFGLDSTIESVGAGLVAEYDTRDVPTNAYTGRRFEAKAIFSRANGVDTTSYQGYYLRIRSYHQLKAPVVIAWDINGCAKNGDFPLWDTCRINLRGFPFTDYLGKQSISGQVEARWRASERWGFVAFGGAGLIRNSFSVQGDNERVPSYGVGARFMVLKSKRINIRVDYSRSDDNDAWYLSVGEAF